MCPQLTSNSSPKVPLAAQHRVKPPHRIKSAATAFAERRYLFQGASQGVGFNDLLCLPAFYKADLERAKLRIFKDSFPEHSFDTIESRLHVGIPQKFNNLETAFPE